MMKSYAMNWLGKTHHAKLYLHTIFNITTIIFLIEALKEKRVSSRTNLKLTHNTILMEYISKAFLTIHRNI